LTAPPATRGAAAGAGAGGIGVGGGGLGDGVGGGGLGIGLDAGLGDSWRDPLEDLSAELAEDGRDSRGGKVHPAPTATVSAAIPVRNQRGSTRVGPLCRCTVGIDAQSIAFGEMVVIGVVTSAKGNEPLVKPSALDGGRLRRRTQNTSLAVLRQRLHAIFTCTRIRGTGATAKRCRTHKVRNGA